MRRHVGGAAVDGNGDADLWAECCKSTEGRLSTLSPRERQVGAALIAGDDTRAMTERLVISRRTVRDHMKSVFAKGRRPQPARGSRPRQRRQRRDIDDTKLTRLQRGA